LPVKRNRRAGVEDRWTKTVRDPDGTTRTVPSANDGKGSRWRARYVDGSGKEHAKGFGRKTDAERWLNGIVAALETGTYVDPRLGKVTLASFYREWSTHQVWVPGTRRAMDLAVNSVTFGDIAFADLRPSHVQAWVKAMQDKPLEPSTINTRFVNVRGVIRAALGDRLITHDVTAKVKLPRQRKASAAMTIPSAAEVGRLLQGADSQFAAYIGLCAFGGLRLGEAAALQVGDVDFLRREIHVRRQVQRANGGNVEIRPPKYSSERTVYAPDGLLTMITEHIRLHRPGGEADRWLFPGEGEHPLQQNSVGYLWRKARDKAGVDYRLHDLRHFYASGLIAAGCDVVTVQRALGHHSASVTLNTYAHLWPDANDRTRKAASDLFASAVDAAADGLRTDSQ
jgi:integrase